MRMTRTTSTVSHALQRTTCKNLPRLPLPDADAEAGGFEIEVVIDGAAAGNNADEDEAQPTDAGMQMRVRLLNLLRGEYGS